MTDDLIHSFRVLHDASRNGKELITENSLPIDLSFSKCEGNYPLN